MSRKREPATWPFVLVLAALFAFSVTAPRQWQRRPERPASARGSDLQLPSTPVAAKEMHDDARGNDPPSAVSSVFDASAHSIVETLQESPSSSATTQPPAPDDATHQEADVFAAPQIAAPALSVAPPPEPAAPASTVASRTSPSKLRRVSPPRRTVKTANRESRSVWGEPALLLDQLDQLAAECDTGEWASRVADVVRQLCRADDLHSPRTTLALKRLRDLADANHPLLAISAHSPKKGELRRLRYAVLRRLDLWELVPDLAEAPSVAGPIGSSQTVSLSAAPRRSSRAAVNVTRLLSDLERFEQTGLSDDGRDLVADVAQMTSLDEQVAARTHRWLEWNYRNSNLRIVLSNELVNRLVPQQPKIEEPVHDRILGVPTRGWSTSTARVGIRLIPDPRSIRFALEVKGIVVARTTSRRDPVTLYSNSDSAFVARKQLQFSGSGLQTWPTEAEVSNSSRLRGVETDFDDVPILGPVVEGIARAKHAETEPAVRRVARRKVAARVKEEIDSAIEPKLNDARQLYREHVSTALEGLALAATIIEMQTSEARLTSRLRLAGDEQLAASTPRPMALSDSLASIQIHQSLVNNVCDRLNLDGKTFTLPELQRRLQEAFKLSPEAFPEEYPNDLRITFAKRDSITARFDEGRIELSVGIAELHRYPKTWRDFQVRVYYRPRINGIDVRLVRDGTVQLRGDHFGREPQIALRGIFSKVFSHDRELMFVNQRVVDDPRLTGLNVTQCVLTDGWIGLSLGSGPLRDARRSVSPLY